MENQQVRLRLVDPKKEFPNAETGTVVLGKDILAQMKKNNVWRHDHVGRYAGVQYDGQTFKFRDNEVITVPETVGRHLRRASNLVVGSDQLNGPTLPYLEIIDSFSMIEPQKQERTPTTCPICDEDQKTYPALARHQMEKHADLFKEAKEPKKISWDAPKTNPINDQEDD